MADSIKNRQFLTRIIRERKSLLAVGLDSDPAKLPPHLNSDVLAFNKSIIDATRDLCVAYKLNFAFYEAAGLNGWDILEKTIACIGDDHFIIADAKRGDIGNTSSMYAHAVFHHLKCDAITVNPYMGKDSVTPFLADGKWAILLALTSNPGSADFEKQILHNGRMVYEEVMYTSSGWGTPDNLMYVLGATHPETIAECRNMYPEHFFLIPGIGAQGGDLDAVLNAGVNAQGGLLINASRSILFASPGKDYTEAARREAQLLQQAMAPYC